MNIYRVSADVGRFSSLDTLDDEVADRMAVKMEDDSPISKRWESLQLKWDPPHKKKPLPQITDVNGIRGLAVLPEGVSFFKQFAPKCCEFLPAELVGDKPVLLAHIFSVDVFPAEHSHDSILGDIATAAREDLIVRRPLFRDRIHRDDGISVPGVYIYATDVFREAYEQTGLTGLEFVPFWPLDDRLQFLRDDIRANAIAETKGELLRGKKQATSPMPQGRVPKAKVTWKKNAKPTPEQLANYLWQAVIDQRMSGEWLGDAASCNTPDAAAITKLAAEAVTRLIEGGADRNVLCHLARSIAFETIGRTLGTFEDVGINWPEDSTDWETLRIALYQEGTVDAAGQLGGWPPAK